MLLLVGLGNPGTEYAANRHNVGFMAVDEIVRRHGFGPARRRFQGTLAEGRLAGRKTLVLKPTTFMNASGRSVGEASRFFKLPVQDIVVFHDEIDLVAGKLRVKRGGGVAGHNGLRSIDAHIGRDFRRVRIGVGRPRLKEDVQRYVLHDFAKADRTWLEPLIDAIAEAAPLLAEDDDAGFATKVALILKPPEKKPPPARLPADEGHDGGGAF
ncbi:MAG: aminoacyl-tRNA hydrolase [Alphaproteobacteria bacterium]|nr:aminoacyl-tRNA hydrolase [Alphaproteobacteria bacterium]